MSNNAVQQLKSVDSKCFPLQTLFIEKFTVDFYQREYVWERKQLEDLINDLSNAFLSCWQPEHTTENVRSYDPYFMGEVVLSTKAGERSAIIDGQQRITTFTLLLIFMLHKYRNVPDFPVAEVQQAIYSSDFGAKRFNLDIDVRKPCMDALFKNGSYEPTDEDKIHVQRLVDRYNDIDDCWDERINENNVSSFAWWILGKVTFSKVWANSDDFAYVIFETMNDRGLPLTPVEMLRSFMLASISADGDISTGVSPRDASLKLFDSIIQRLTSIKLPSKSKAESEFFRVFLRGHYAETLSKGDQSSDFVRIGNAFHRWIRENKSNIGLKKSSDFVDLINQFDYFSKQYELIYKMIEERKTDEYLYLIVNSDYGFTLQPALILASIAYKDDENTVLEKIKKVSKYLTRVLSYRIWNHWRIAQSSMEADIYTLCREIRNASLSDLDLKLNNNSFVKIPSLDNSPMLNQQNKPKLRVLLSLITEIVAKESGVPDYMLNKEDIDVEHIWSDHFDQHLDEFTTKEDFSNSRNNIGALLVLPKSFNRSYGDDSYEKKLEQYFGQNILAASLHKNMYENHPGFKRYIERSGLNFKYYEHFKKNDISERAALYKAILQFDLEN